MTNSKLFITIYWKVGETIDEEVSKQMWPVWSTEEIIQIMYSKGICVQMLCAGPMELTPHGT